MAGRGSSLGLSCATACLSACMINPAFDEPSAGTGSSTSTAMGSSEAATGTAVTTGTGASESGSESGTSASCGNGIVEGDEPCDDGNAIDGDGCNAGCIAGGTRLWELRRDGGGGGWDTAHDLAVLPSDDVVVAGTLDVEGLQAELVRIDRDGVELWSHPHAVEGAADSDAWGAAVLGEGAVLAGTGDNDVMFVRALDGDGAELWTLESPGRVYDASSTGDSAIWIAGRLPDESAAMWHVAPDGTLVAIHDEASGSMPTGSVVWGIALGQNGRIGAAGEVIDASRAFVRSLYENGGVAWEIDVTQLGADADSAYGVTIAPGGALAMVGDVERGAERNGWLLRRDTGGRLLPPIEQDELGNYHGVAIGPTGEIAIAGWVDNGLGKIALVVKYGVDGTLAWRDEIAGDIGVGENKGWSVGIRSDMVVVAAGEVVESATGTDQWIAAWAP